MRVVIFTEAGRDIGFGHLIRCMSLAQAFEEKGIETEFVVSGDETVTDLLSSRKHIILNWHNEKDRLFDKISGADITVVDSYIANKSSYKDIADMANLAVYMDDNKRIDYPAGVVVNGSMLTGEINYPVKENIEYLTGTEYIPLRKEFWEIAEKDIRNEMEHVLITFGGSDPFNITPGILELMVSEYPGIYKTVVIGQGFMNKSEIEDIKDEKTRLIFNPDAEEMKRLMSDADIAVSAGGQTLYELACTGTPTIAVAVAENQMNNIKGWLKAGFIEYAGWWEDESLSDNIYKGIKALKEKASRAVRSEAGRKNVDGQGARRTAGRCLGMLFDKNIVLSPAGPDDVRDVYELSNEPGVRKSSFNTQHIEFEEHEKWFIERLNDNSCIFMIARYREDVLGQVRFNVDGDEAVVSISISKKYRALGAGGIINRKALKYLEAAAPDVVVVKAFIKKDNDFSVEFFEKAGYEFVKELEVKGRDALEYEYRCMNE